MARSAGSATMWPRTCPATSARRAAACSWSDTAACAESTSRSAAGRRLNSEFGTSLAGSNQSRRPAVSVRKVRLNSGSRWRLSASTRRSAMAGDCNSSALAFRALLARRRQACVRCLGVRLALVRAGPGSPPRTAVAPGSHGARSAQAPREPGWPETACGTTGCGRAPARRSSAGGGRRAAAVLAPRWAISPAVASPFLPVPLRPGPEPDRPRVMGRQELESRSAKARQLVTIPINDPSLMIRERRGCLHEIEADMNPSRQGAVTSGIDILGARRRSPWWSDRLRRAWLPHLLPGLWALMAAWPVLAAARLRGGPARDRVGSRIPSTFRSSWR